MIEDVLDTFRTTTSAVNQAFVRKSQIEPSTCPILTLKHAYLGYAILQPKVKKIRTLNNAKMAYIGHQKAVFFMMISIFSQNSPYCIDSWNIYSWKLILKAKEHKFELKKR